MRRFEKIPPLGSIFGGRGEGRGGIVKVDRVG